MIPIQDAHSRAAAAEAGVHGKTVAGIHGTKKHGAYSIVLSGGYEDDVDEGDRMCVPLPFSSLPPHLT